jgi:hypothetical protein
LFREGDAGDALYVIRAGRLQVIDERTGQVISEIGRGDALGELALLTDSPRSASARAARATDLVVVQRAQFERLMHASPALPVAVSRILAEQLRVSRPTVHRRRPRPATVVLVALSDGAPVSKLAHGLADALTPDVSAVLLDPSAHPAPAAADEAASIYGPLLDRAEAGHDIVVLDAGLLTAGGTWTEYCLQQGDRILAVAPGGPVPAALADHPELHGCELVAYDVRQGSGALEGWAAALDPIETHVVRSATFEADLVRMARRLSGRSVGIVLSGGGARGFAHIGVLEELTAAGVAIDRVAGVSMGAFVGALFALGLDADEIDARCFEEWVQRNPMGD